ncbi:SDR family NAD(P)-dependent oxidoreductase [Acidisoma cellulosilytica]|uniref:SDR family NAD(P)-dependent oxidoreductase n=1 Tax=Acidisoma cellulosilyticum TaxID=2802395 RepID=A0A963Z545_9PROT|nr:SDR family NAD(P)-dependent oxidoreductase [Acidisoma cellulosilyticum]MCB8882656.1 SDR family NAD(P)-dependent oxidoreductase [Acidisoma cellulosilyticum]
MAKTVLITGANKGIGFETARRLGELGYRIWLGARDAERGETAAQALRAHGYDVRTIDIAVDDAVRVKAAAGRVAAEDGTLDALIVNAGISGAYVDPMEQDLDDIRHVYEVNVFGAISVIQAFVPLLKAAGSANIVNVSSELGSLSSLSDPGGAFWGVNILGYNSSKTALNGVTVSFAKALARFGIRVNSADPGYTATDFTNQMGYRTVEQAAEIIVQLAISEDATQTGRFLNDHCTLPW